MRTATSMVGAVALGALLMAARAQAVCVGDCNGDGMVSINELILGVNIAQGSAPLSMCPSFDADGDGMVGINELITAVNNALNGCGTPGACSGTERVFSVEPGTLLAPPGNVTNMDTTRTGLFTTGLGGSNAAMRFPPGPLTLILGTPDANGVACLSLKDDVTLSIEIVDSTCLCFKMLKAGAAGSVDCNGGTAYDSEARRTAGMAGFGWTAMTGLGTPAAGAGNGNLLVMGLFERVMMTCAAADCPNHTYASPANLFAFTTTSAHAVQETASAPIELTVPGEAFNCTSFATPGSGGMLAAPAPTTIDPIGDVANVFRLADSKMPPAP